MAGACLLGVILHAVVQYSYFYGGDETPSEVGGESAMDVSRISMGGQANVAFQI